MRRFRDGDMDILVTTAVVEVGIDVPNATVMLIEGADRFGLAQLHQFRGRVGRGEHRSYCLLLSESESETANQRLQALVDNTDGFELGAERPGAARPRRFLRHPPKRTAQSADGQFRRAEYAGKGAR